MLLAYILRRVKPLPITFLPESSRKLEEPASA